MMTGFPKIEGKARGVLFTWISKYCTVLLSLHAGLCKTRFIKYCKIDKLRVGHLRLETQLKRLVHIRSKDKHKFRDLTPKLAKFETNISTETRGISIMLACLNHSVSYSSPVASPTVDLGKDFDMLIRKCIAEKSSNVFPGSLLSQPATPTSLGNSTEQGNSSQRILSGQDDTGKDDEDQEKLEPLTKIVSDNVDYTVNEVNSESNVEKTVKTTKVWDDAIQVVTPLKNADVSEDDWPVLERSNRAVKDLGKTNINKSKKSDKESRKKKWKCAPKSMLCFEFSLLPRRDPVDIVSPDAIEHELKKFEQEIADVNGNKVSTDSTDHTESPSSENAQADENKSGEIIAEDKPCDALCDLTAKSTQKVVIDYFEEEHYIDICESSSGICATCLYDVEEKVPVSVRLKCDKFSDNTRGGLRLRNKKKWRVQKAHKQVKSKHVRSVCNRPHGKALYIHHRLAHIISNMVRKMSHLPSWRTLKRIDAKDLTKCVPSSSPVTASRIYNPPSSQNQRNPAHAMTAYNADGALDAAVVNLLLTLQNRDITPQDYELLLRLDERVKPQTVGTNTVDSYKKDVATDAHVNEECTVCMSNYTPGDSRKYLPCGHKFHTECIDNWLKNFSMNCPLDGLSVTEA